MLDVFDFDVTEGEANVSLHGELHDDRIEIEAQFSFEKEGRRLEGSFSIVAEDGTIALPPIPIGDPITDFSICVAARGLGPVATTVVRCYRANDGDRRKTFQCIKDQGEALGWTLIKAVVRCGLRQIGGDMIDFMDLL